MKYQYRLVSGKLLRAMEFFPVIVLTGARQVGKSTLLRELLGKKYEIIVFDPLLDIDNARSEPELFFRNHPGPVVLDEIQYAPELIPVIKRLVDADRAPGKYVLTGSQQWGVLKGVAESLAGRVAVINLMGFNLDEAAGLSEESKVLARLFKGDMVDLLSGPTRSLPATPAEYLFRGQLPEAQSLPLDIIPTWLDSYIATYIERDVRLMADVGDLQLFSRFYRLCAALSAQEVNYSQLGRDLGISPQTARRWLGIMESGFQWKEIPAYSGNTLKRISSKPKGYFMDTGLLCRSLFISTPKAVPSHPGWGSMVETLIVLELMKAIECLAGAPAVYHWRSHSGAELDLVLERDGRFFPLEIKATTRPGRKDSSGIQAFRETYPKLDIGPGVVVHLGDDSFMLTDHDIALSWLAF
jgi:predicted AAA+ superfamily ATPase